MRVLIILGSDSDIPQMEGTKKLLAQFKIPFDLVVASAHRNPKKVSKIASQAEAKYDIVIAAAGGAAHLPGVVAANTTLPVIGVPIETKSLSGFDSLYSIVQMPSGIPVATVAIGGAKNAAILAAQMLSLKYPKLRSALKGLKRKMEKGVKI
jgi:5-(carboxyamino)imidazole ribonucleotide mutase